MILNGLNDQQVEVSRKKYGSNKLPEPKQKTWFDFLKETLKDKITIILIMMAGVFFTLAILGVESFSEPIMILTVLAIVCGLNVKTNLSIQKSNNKLRAKTAIRYCNVIRNGSVVKINKDDIVIGDIVCLEMGQEIFADGYVIDGEIAVSNAAINGETKECKKHYVPGFTYPNKILTDHYTDETCVFAGTTVMSGEAKMLVQTVGINTVNGDTLVKMQTLEPPKTALDIALDKLADFISKWGTAAAFGGFLIATATGILDVGFKEYFAGDILQVVRTIAENVSVALTIIVAAVPEGLPMIVKFVTKMNVKTMERANILTKNPSKIPELAYVNYVCTDKTGTLTTGVMTPRKIVTGDIKSEKIDKNNIPEILKENIALTSGSVFDKKGKITGGNSIDRAMLSLLNQSEFNSILTQKLKFKKQPFNSQYKYSAFSTRNQGVVTTYYKGAPEKILSNCKYRNVNGKVEKMTDADRMAIQDEIYALTTKAMRCIAFAYTSEALEENVISDNLTFIAVIGVQDPVRPEVPNAVKTAQEAGITVVEITGDCIETAVAIAEEAGIYKKGNLALTDAEFAKMSDEQIKKIIPILRVAQCALAGRAAARLAEVTGEEGYTIHRLLGFPIGEDIHGKFSFYDGNYLPFDIIIVDEISMVDSKLFFRLIDAIKPGTKLIMLGDTGQLECIGSGNIAHDLIESPYIRSIELTKIHRQAEASAIITDSLKVRHNSQVVDKGFVGHMVRGDLQDLEYDCYSDANNTYFSICKEFAQWLEKIDDILDLQVIVPIKERQSGVWNLNTALQELYNPLEESGKELCVRYNATHFSYLRVGDKVMYTANNYKAILYNGHWNLDPREYKEYSRHVEVFNGSIGIIEDINEEREEVIINFQYIGRVLILKKQLAQVELSYAITVHKAQGSQYPYVIVGIDFSSYSLLTKELVYTAITRAIKHCVIKAQTNALRYAVAQNAISNKQTYLVEAIEKIKKPVF